MVIQVTDIAGKQIKQMGDAYFDAELNGGNRDFVFEFNRSNYDAKITYGSRIFVPDTEIGGILGELKTSTSQDVYIWSGYTWRGLLARKIIVPPVGMSHYTVSGELNTILRDLIEPVFGGVFLVPVTDTGVAVSNFKFERFCTLLDGLVTLLKSVKYRLEIRYNQGEPNHAGWVEIQAVPIADYSSEIELSGDSQLHFTMTEKKNGVNHLVVGDKDDAERQTLHLYVQKDGSIGKTQHYFGLDEIVEFYNAASRNEADQEEKGRKKLEKLKNAKNFEMDVEALGIDVAIGDIVGGRDNISGMYASIPIENIVVTVEEGIVTKEYKLEGN